MTDARKIVVFTKTAERQKKFSSALESLGVSFAQIDETVIADLLNVRSPDYHAKLMEWASKGFTECIIDARFMAVSMGTPADWVNARNMVIQTRGDLDSWAVALWGVGGEHAAAIAKAIREDSPKAIVVQRDFTTFPLSSSDVDAKMVDLLWSAHLIGEPLKKRYGTKRDDPKRAKSIEVEDVIEEKPQKKTFLKGFGKGGKNG